MRRFLAVLSGILAILAVFALAGCGNTEILQATEPRIETETTETTAEPTIEATLEQTEETTLNYRQIDADEAKEIIDSETGYIILDVRTEEEFAEGHIPGAILIPDYEIAERAEAELTDKSQKILVYCRSGNRSKVAAKILADMGYTDIIEFGGIKGWPYDIEK